MVGLCALGYRVDYNETKKIHEHGRFNNRFSNDFIAICNESIAYTATKIPYCSSIKANLLDMITSC